MTPPNSPRNEMANGWLPIEMAPSGKSIIGRFVESFDGKAIVGTCYMHPIGNWTTTKFNGVALPAPTHWQPLPLADLSAPPSPDAGKGGGALLNPVGCHHDYKSVYLGDGFERFLCDKCGDTYVIDEEELK